MGEQKRRQYSHKQFLIEHRHCIYCGDEATTTDHCPPRCFFVGRHWPESYEFPACKACNEAARLDEQALALLLRTRADSPSPQAFDEWLALFNGVKNNLPGVLAEWGQTSGASRKRALRNVFGRERGDLLRRQGFGTFNVGGSNKAILNRFSVKLGKALFYLHNRLLFEGAIYSRHLNSFLLADSVEMLETFHTIAPNIVSVGRTGKSLSDQFIYMYGNDVEERTLCALVQFSDQHLFEIFAMGSASEAQFREFIDDVQGPLAFARTECRLRFRPDRMV